MADKATPKENSDVDFKSFLESVQPNVTKQVKDAWARTSPFSGTPYDSLRTPALLLHCSKCDGERNFRVEGVYKLADRINIHHVYPIYRCGDCREVFRTFSVHLRKEADGQGQVTKFGEIPPMGAPVPNKVLRLLGKDRDLFLKGRKCENQGLGVGAYAYYRRVVENHKNDIFDAIIKVCETLEGNDNLVKELRAAKKEISFSSSVEKIKALFPEGLLINGRNPLLALHSALSIGLHNDSDESCLTTAHAIRLVLTGLVERMSILREDNKELHDAIELLIAKQATEAAEPSPDSVRIEKGRPAALKLQGQGVLDSSGSRGKAATQD